jgi:hypothetical protein
LRRGKIADQHLVGGKTPFALTGTLALRTKTLVVMQSACVVHQMHGLLNLTQRVSCINGCQNDHTPAGLGEIARSDPFAELERNVRTDYMAFTQCSTLFGVRLNLGERWSFTGMKCANSTIASGL